MLVSLGQETIASLNSLQISKKPGGYQGLVQLIRNKVDQFGYQISVTDEEYERIKRYSKYGSGNGGYQHLFRLIMEDANIS